MKKPPKLPKAEIWYAPCDGDKYGLYRPYWGLEIARAFSGRNQGIVKVRVTPIAWVRKPK